MNFDLEVSSNVQIKVDLSFACHEGMCENGSTAPLVLSLGCRRRWIPASRTGRFTPWEGGQVTRVGLITGVDVLEEKSFYLCGGSNHDLSVLQHVASKLYIK
jgi:hypothetical protein